MLTSTRPALAVANCVSTHSARLGDQIPIRSPCARPRSMRPDARASTRSRNSVHVQRTAWCRTIRARERSAPHSVEGFADRDAQQRVLWRRGRNWSSTRGHYGTHGSLGRVAPGRGAGMRHRGARAASTDAVSPPGAPGRPRVMRARQAPIADAIIPAYEDAIGAVRSPESSRARCRPPRGRRLPPASRVSSRSTARARRPTSGTSSRFECRPRSRRR